MNEQETLQVPRSHAAHGQAPTRREPTREIAPGVACLPLSIVNLYFWGEPGAGDRDWVLIDAGLPLSEGSILDAAARRFGENSRPLAIVLTHGHFDHVGALPRLVAHWDVPVYAHEMELPYLSGQSSYPPPDPAVGGGAMSFLSPLYPRGPIDLDGQLRALPADGVVPGMPGWRWVHTPGHTPGHVSLFRESDRVLIAGDAFVTAKQESLVDALLQWDTASAPAAGVLHTGLGVRADPSRGWPDSGRRSLPPGTAGQCTGSGCGENSISSGDTGTSRPCLPTAGTSAGRRLPIREALSGSHRPSPTRDGSRWPRSAASRWECGGCASPDRGPSNHRRFHKETIMNEERVAHALGWFSIGLGLAEVLRRANARPLAGDGRGHRPAEGLWGPRDRHRPGHPFHAAAHRLGLGAGCGRRHRPRRDGLRLHRGQSPSRQSSGGHRPRWRVSPLRTSGVPGV